MDDWSKLGRLAARTRIFEKEAQMSHEQTGQTPVRLSRRSALRAGAALGAVGAGAAIGPAATALAAQGGWRTEHLEWDFVPTASSTPRAGSGPPQRGDFFSAWGPMFAVGDRRAQLGTYNCFGVWTSASTDTLLPYTRLATVQFDLGERGSVFGVINEGPPPGAADPVGVIQGGTGRYAGAQGTFQQGTVTPAAPPAPAQVRAVLDLLIPGQG